MAKMTNKLVVVMTCVDSGPLAEEALYHLRQNTNKVTPIVLLDNGSYTPLTKYDADVLLRFEDNRGANAVFHRMIPYLESVGADCVAYFHTDLMVRENDWDQHVVTMFDIDPKLSLMGFLGSDEIDAAGGRGLGTRSSFIGGEYRTVWASPAEVHGARSKGLQAAAVVDHMSMIFRVSTLKELPKQEEMHTPGHFYDRILSCEILHRGLHIATLGIDCDHTGGGTGLAKARVSNDIPEPGVLNRDECYKKWLTEHRIDFDPERVDHAVYLEGEKRYLYKWRDVLKFIPLRVLPDYSIEHRHPDWVAS
jgi:hypothetical protein